MARRMISFSVHRCRRHGWGGAQLHSLARGSDAFPRLVVMLQVERRNLFISAPNLCFSSQFNSKSQSLTYGKVGLVGSSKSKEQVMSDIYEALKHGDEQVSVKAFISLFELKDLVTKHDCISILNWCSNHNMTKMAELFWKVMEGSQIEPDARIVASFLRILSRGGYLDEALGLLQLLGKEVQANVVLCNIFLNGCSIRGSVTHAEQCLRFMKEKGIKEDGVTYLELIKLAGKRKDFSAIKKAWTNLIKVYKPSIYLYHTLVVALSRTGALAESLKACQEMLLWVTRVSKSKSNVGEGPSLMNLGTIRAVYAGENIMDEADLSAGEQNTSEVSMVPMKTIAHSCSQMHLEQYDVPAGANAPEESSDLPFCQDYMNDKRVSDVGSSTVRVTSCQKLSHKRIQSKNLIGTPVIVGGTTNFQNSSHETWTSHMFLETNECFQQHDVDMGSSFLQECLKSIRLLKLDHLSEKVQSEIVSSVNAIINAAVNRKKFLTAEKLFMEMKAVGLKLDLYAYNAVLRAAVRTRGLASALQLVQDLEMQGIEPDMNTHSAVLEGFCRNLDLVKAEALLKRMTESKNVRELSCVNFNIVLNACAAMDDLQGALRIFAQMKLAGIKPDACTIVALISAFGRVNYPFQTGTPESRTELSRRLFAIESYMASCKLRHTRHSFTSMLTALGAEGMIDAVIQHLHKAEDCMDNDGFPILDVVSYNVALHACVQSNQFEAATVVFRKMTLLKIKPDCCTYNIMINGCCKSQRIADAFQLTEIMRKGTLTPDLWTYNTLIKAICHADEFDSALALLKEMQMRGVQPDRVTFNTLISSAVYRNQLDVTEFLLEHMNKSKIQPDLITCEHVISIYESNGKWDDAAEALRVLSLRMFSFEGGNLDKMQDVLLELFTEDGSEVVDTTLDLYDDAVYETGFYSKSLLAARLSGFGSVPANLWDIRNSPWVKRLCIEYKTKSLFV